LFWVFFCPLSFFSPKTTKKKEEGGPPYNQNKEEEGRRRSSLVDGWVGVFIASKELITEFRPSLSCVG